jgi:flagellar motor switch protein FliM
VELSPSPINAEDLASLSVGDLIATEHRVDSPVIVNLDDQPIFLGRLGATAGRKAVRLETESTAPRH